MGVGWGGRVGGVGGVGGCGRGLTRGLCGRPEDTLGDKPAAASPFKVVASPCSPNATLARSAHYRSPACRIAATPRAAQYHNPAPAHQLAAHVVGRLEGAVVQEVGKAPLVVLACAGERAPGGKQLSGATGGHTPQAVCTRAGAGSGKRAPLGSRHVATPAVVHDARRWQQNPGCTVVRPHRAACRRGTR